MEMVTSVSDRRCSLVREVITHCGLKTLDGCPDMSGSPTEMFLVVSIDVIPPLVDIHHPVHPVIV